MAAQRGLWAICPSTFREKLFLHRTRLDSENGPYAHPIQGAGMYCKPGTPCLVRGILTPNGYDEWLEGTFVRYEERTYLDQVPTSAITVRYHVNGEEREGVFHPRWREIWLDKLTKPMEWDDNLFLDFAKARVVFVPYNGVGSPFDESLIAPGVPLPPSSHITWMENIFWETFKTEDGNEEHHLTLPHKKGVVHSRTRVPAIYPFLSNAYEFSSDQRTGKLMRELDARVVVQGLHKHVRSKLEYL